MDNVKHYSSFIKRIITAPEPIKVKLFKSSNPKIITAITEIIYNIINKNIKVSVANLRSLENLRRYIIN